MLKIFPISALTFPFLAPPVLIAMLSGCVLPLAPEFEDPPSPLNYAPHFQTTVPPIGTVITAPPTGDVTFSITLLDPNILDTLHVRWVADYPVFTDDTRNMEQRLIVPAADGKPLRAPISITPSCVNHTLAKGLQRHQIVAIVSDRGFLTLKPEDDQLHPFTKIPPDGFLAVAVWTLNLECR